jgi:hypothetical protein
MPSSSSSLSIPTMDFSIICNSHPRPIHSTTASANREIGRPPLVPALTVLTRSKSPLKSVVTQETITPINPYRGKDWEYVNTNLHRKYPMAEPGLISLRDFIVTEAAKDLKDLQDLKTGEVEDDEQLHMTKLWINKLKFAIKQEMITDSDSGSDNGSAYEEEDL